MLTDYDSDDYVLFKFQRLGHLVIFASNNCTVKADAPKV